MQDVEIATEIVSMKKDIEYIKEKMDSFEDRIDTFIETADTKYSPKWVETIVKILIGTILTSVLAALLNLILRK